MIVKNTLSKINEITRNQRFFHWELEFPDIFQRQNYGFDCILGNPPFVGGLRIRGALRASVLLNYSFPVNCLFPDGSQASNELQNQTSRDRFMLIFGI